MADRRPIAVVGGLPREIPSSDRVLAGDLWATGASAFGAAASTRGLSVAATGQITFRYDDNSLAYFAGFANQGMTAANQGVSVGYTLGLSGGSAVLAAAQDVIALDTFADSTKRLTRWRWRALSATGVLITLLTMDAAGGAVFGTGATFGGASSVPLLSMVPASGDITQRIEGGFYQYNLCTKALGWPEDSNNWAHLLSVTHSSTSSYYAMQFAGGFFDNDNFYARKTNASGTASWRKLVHDASTFSKSGITSPALRTIPDLVFQRHDLRDYAGVDYAGNNDSASVVQRALTASSNAGTDGKLWIPNGQIPLGSTIDITAGVNVVGNAPVYSRIQAGQSHRGTNFILAHTGVGFQSIGQYQTGQIENLSTSRLQPDFANAASGTAFTPIDAQWDFLLSSRTTLRRIHCLNPTRMIAMQDASYGQGNLFEITGEPLLEGIYIRNANDMVFANAWNLWPWWTLDAPTERRDQVWKWKHNNATAIRLGRVDAAQWANIFVIGYRNSLVLQDYVNSDTSTAGQAQNGHFSGNITNLALDASVYPFTCSASGVIANLGLGINGGLLSAAAGTNIGADATAIITGSNNFLSFEQFTAAHSQKGVVVVRGSNNILKFPDGCHIGYWNEGGGNLPGIYKEGTNNQIIFGQAATSFGPTPSGAILGSGIQIPTYTTTS